MDPASPFRVPAAPTRPCPRCDLGLGSRHVLDAVLDECSDCTGVFVPIELVPRLVDPLDLGLEVVRTFAPGEPETESTVRYLRCPRCAGLMNRRLLVRGSNVIVDVCKGHGVWFDAHELRRVAELGTHREIVVQLDRTTEARASANEEYLKQRRAAAMIHAADAHDRGSLLASVLRVLAQRFWR